METSPQPHQYMPRLAQNVSHDYQGGDWLIIISRMILTIIRLTIQEMRATHKCLQHEQGLKRG